MCMHKSKKKKFVEENSLFACVIMKSLDNSDLSLFYVSYEVLTKSSFSLLSNKDVSVWILYILKN